MNREIHVRLCERLGAKFPGPTRRSAGDRRPYADLVGHSEVETPAGMKFSIYGLPVIPEFLGPIHRT